MTKPVTIDEIDAKILKTLLLDVRTSFVDIAKDCGVSTNTIVKRYYKLRQSGVITGTSLIVNLDDAGYDFVISTDMNVEPNYEGAILETLNNMPNCIDHFPVVGNYDVHAIFVVRNFQEIDQVRNQIKTQKGITRVRVTAHLSKHGFLPKNLLIQPAENNKNG
ncbi:MAG: Lrp/AsnC family transcriptional regulator [Candidatus Bathyarchaeota archaeon]|nr:Lrp/AsnC family transcriptional regulator [Candidatus Bathyarchaeum sp.]